MVLSLSNLFDVHLTDRSRDTERRERGKSEARTGEPCHADAYRRYHIYRGCPRVLEVLASHRGNQCKAAKELGVHRNTLSRTLEELGIDPTQTRMSLKRPPRSARLHLEQKQAGQSS
jgi:DNA-binding NtrC family response regulator